MNQSNKLKMFMFNAIPKKKKTGPIWCDYLESDGSQIIQVTEPLDIKKNICIKIRVKWLNPLPNRRQAMGISNGAAGKYFEIRPNPDGKIVYAQGNTYSEVEPSLDDFDEILFDAQTWEGILYVNGKEAIRRNSNVGGQAMLDLFGMAQYPQFNCVCQISSAQIYYSESKELIRNLRPCLHPDTMDPCMYDTVEGKYYFKPSGHAFKYQISFDALDHITTDGHQYIDTGFSGNTKDISFECKMKIDTSNQLYQYPCLFGSRENPSQKRFYVIYSYKNSKYYFGLNTSEMSYILQLKGANIWTYNMDKDTSYAVNETPMVKLSNHFDCNTLWLFNCHYAVGQERREIIGSIYYFKAWTNGILERDMIPVKKKDGTICMYDFVGGAYYENEGTGNFTGA